MLDSLFDLLQWWHWIVISLILFILEVFSPAAFFMWMGFSAAATGFVYWLTPGLSWEIQVLLFSVLSVISITIGRLWFKRHPIETDQPLLNERGSEFIGHTYRVDTAIVNGVGRIAIGESTWKAVADQDFKAGESVRVISADGPVLKVEAI